jgi:putative oxidoreductase
VNRRSLDFALLFLRIILAVVFFAHGAQKVLGWFGGPGLPAFVGYMTSQGMPRVVAYLVAFGELAGSVALLVGFLTRLAAAGLMIEMLGATFLVHWKNGFFMNWSGKLKGEGFEYSLTLAVLSFAVLLAGAGAFSIDANLGRNRLRRR